MAGRPRSEWSFGYAELVEATGHSRNALVTCRRRGEFDPEGDIVSVACLLARKGTEETRRRILASMLEWVNPEKTVAGPRSRKK